MYLESIYNENILVNIKDLNIFLKSNSNINDFLLDSLKKKIGNKCNNDGLVIKESINIIYRNCGIFRLNEKILYKLKYTAKILFPTEGCILNNCKIIFISSILYIAKMKENNLIIILPRNFIKKPIDVKKNKYINILCLDKYYELNDKYMFIIGIPYFNSININTINETLENDDICKNIYENITDFKHEYENLFNKLQESEEELLIDYEEAIKPIELNSVLTTLIHNLDLYIKENYKSINYKINTSTLNNYYSIYNIYDLLQLKIDTLTKYNIFSDYDIYIKNKNKNRNQYNNFIETNDSYTLINNMTYCNIISSLQLLKHCKLFIKSFYDLFDKQELDKDSLPDTYKLYLELNKIFTGEQNNIDDLLDILELLNKSENLQFDFLRLNNIEDFIKFLFSLLDKNIDNSLYIKNVYDDVKIKTTKTNIENNIGYYINKLNNSNKNSTLHKFYNINISEYKCTTCLFRFYHIKNNLICNIIPDNNDNISKCIHSLNIVPQLVEGLECNVCNNNTIYKSSYLYLNPTDYLIFNLNRVLFEETLTKNKSELFINNRITFKNVDINSTNNIKTNDFILDLKTIICHIGTLSNGHYICLNKNSNDSFYLYDDNKKYIVTQDKFYINTLFKSEVCNLVYQLNNINSPLSDILLLEYEEDYLKENTTDSFINYIKNNNKLGINIKTQITGGSQTITNMNDNILIRLFNLDINQNKKNYISLLNNFFKTLKDIILDKEDSFNKLLTEYYDENIITILPKFEELYIYLIHKFTSDFTNKLIDKTITIPDFLSDNSLYNKINIHLGTSGYNTNKTNHWDVIYEISNNNLEFYSEHFNSVEINDTYYQDFDSSYWTYLEEKLSVLDSKLSVSIVFNKELSDVLLNNNNLENSDLEDLFKTVFNKYYEDKIQIIEDYIHNIIFIFDSNFIYNDNNFNNLNLFVDYVKTYTGCNLLFEFNDNSWFNNSVANYFLKNNLYFVTLIINNNNNDFGYNLTSNIEFIDSYDFTINYIKLYGSISKFNGSHINDLFMLLNSIISNANKKYNNLSKFEKSDKSQYIYFNNIETDFLNKRYKNSINNLDINTIPNFNKSNSTELTEDSDIQKSTDTPELNEEEDEEETEINEDMDNLVDLDIDSETITENLNIPSAVFDAKCLYKLLDKLNKLK